MQAAVTTTAMPWAYQAVVNYARMQRGCGLPPPQRAPNLLLSRPCDGVRRAVWLFHRPGGVLGLVVGPRLGVPYGGSVPRQQQPLASSAGERRVMRHLRLLPFPAAGAGLLCRPIVVHTNHLIGWCLDGGDAAPLYAHSVDQLARLQPRRLTTLSPDNTLVCTTYYEWDDWREAAREPGWSWHYADEHVANGLVSGQLSPDDLCFLAPAGP
ncbi:hypothetical protein TraAM80_04186 [Trypanosoma rangeli]|uniref:Uncharacterized protein n=1 Tax=Trypanosoma rangeli TaxID=5698 RepID=A0A3R7NG27_TRYRA|nr:uncharacterized protein TraAM80_04186 [Trypanosoma rangeli]RNF06032.1 hypothetical protein TraAM80_04186 [Trypanosoma rangeli]|eukprot:RNF06032.1 hypothetical protein TraAM80_04186 [Trypanosoma rangeli]